jgi:hypothetical protein
MSPNPATNKLTVSTVVQTNNSNVRIEIIGENGFIYFTKDFPSQNSGNFSSEINLFFLNNGGLYFIRTTVGSQVFANKVVIIR